MTPRYWPGEPVTVRPSIWCYTRSQQWHPLPVEDDAVVEKEYLNFAASHVKTPSSSADTSSSAASSESRMSAPYSFETPTYSVTFSCNEGSEIAVSAKTKGVIGSFFSLPIVLSRGWGGPSEEDDANDEKPAKHLVLVVHGIGESMFSKGNTKLPPFKESVTRMRSISLDLNADKDYKTEFIPVEWFHRVQEKKDELAQSTLPSIPMMRQFANEALLDGLLLLTPRWRKVILDTVTEGLVNVFQVFSKCNLDWNPENVSVAGHSLGTVILFELLSSNNLPETQRIPFVPQYFMAMGSPVAVFMNTVEDDPSWLNERVTKMRISKSMRNVFHPNDPVAYRLEPLLAPCQHQTTPQEAAGARTSAEDTSVGVTQHREPDEVQSVTSTAEKNTLISLRASRMEPPLPVFINTVSGDDRIHVKWRKATNKFQDQQAKMKQIVTDASTEWSDKFSGLWAGSGGEELKKFDYGRSSGSSKAVDGTASTQSASQKTTFCLKCFETRIPQYGAHVSDLASLQDDVGGIFGNFRKKLGPADDDAKTKAEVAKAMRRKLQEAHRIDYVLQVSELEASMTEYLSAVQAHSCYFENPDVIKFILESLDSD